MFFPHFERSGTLSPVFQHSSLVFIWSSEYVEHSAAFVHGPWFANWSAGQVRRFPGHAGGSLTAVCVLGFIQLPPRASTFTLHCGERHMPALRAFKNQVQRRPLRAASLSQTCSLSPWFVSCAVCKPELYCLHRIASRFTFSYTTRMNRGSTVWLYLPPPCFSDSFSFFNSFSLSPFFPGYF